MVAGNKVNILKIDTGILSGNKFIGAIENSVFYIIKIKIKLKQKTSMDPAQKMTY